MPFLYMVRDNGKTTYLVLIGKFNYRYYNHLWWGPQENITSDAYVYQPDIDLVDVENMFDTEEEAFIFIKEWWAKNES